MTVSYLDIMSEIRKQGFPVFIMGGSVRDVLADIMPNINDMDMGFGCTPEELQNIFHNKVNYMHNCV